MPTLGFDRHLLPHYASDRGKLAGRKEDFERYIKPNNEGIRGNHRVYGGWTEPSHLANFEASSETKARVAHLIYKEKTAGLEPEEKAELDDVMQLEHLMRLVKARARGPAS